jgi:hypothetical protein
MDGNKRRKPIRPATDEVPERVYASVARYFGLLAAPARLLADVHAGRGAHRSRLVAMRG